MLEEKEQQQRKEFNISFPAVELLSKNYSLQADMITGWKPKFRVVGPIPFNFDSPILDEIIDELTSFGQKYKERVIYLGYRYNNSFKMHQEVKHRYRFKHEGIINGSFSNMAAYFRKFHSNFKSTTTGRLFKGMNPTIKPSEEFVFDSNFESGNLDAAIKVGENQYDLFMRVDTNTRGHIQWFNFSVKNNGMKKIKLNIVNFRKFKTLYNRGMKPFIFSEYQNQTKKQGWVQGGQNVKYDKCKLRYKFLQEEFHEEALTFNCLKFEYYFQTDWETVQFAYCPPFTYSQMMESVAKVRRNDLSEIKNYITQQTLCESLGGLDIPLLTITDPQIENNQKKCILVWGRIHPGQTCGSYMLNGFLKFVSSDIEQARILRKKVVFKVIPMLNPDGVVVGNFRTSFCGRDLNRQFKTQSTFLIPEVKAVKELVLKLKNEFKSRLIFFLDMHGHSVKKNVFLYGPEYEIWQTSYYRTRIFPKIISLKTQIFRYYSCMFRIADFKRTTARAVLLNHIPHCYTFEASVSSYYSPEEKKDINFTTQLWEYMGKTIGESVFDYIELMYDKQMTKKERSQKINQLKTYKRVVRKTSNSKNQYFQTRLLSVNSTHKTKVAEKKESHQIQTLNQKIAQFIDEIKKDQERKMFNKDQHESDSFSEGGSDSEGEEDDIPEEEMTIYRKQIQNSMNEFQQKFYNNKNEKESIFKNSQKRSFEKNFRNSVRIRQTRQSKGIQMIASLRKKAEELQKAESVLVCKKFKSELKSQTAELGKGEKLKAKMSFQNYLRDVTKKDKIQEQSSSFL